MCLPARAIAIPTFSATRRNSAFFAGRVYTPEPASPEEMAALHKSLHIKRVVIVTPSVYGTDNSATLYGMKARGATARGVAVIDDKTPESELDAMDTAGIRGIRINLATGGINDPAVARQRLAGALSIGRRGAIGTCRSISNLPVIAALKSDLRNRRCRWCSTISAALRPRSASTSRALPTSSSSSEAAKPMSRFPAPIGLRSRRRTTATSLPFAKALIAANPDRIVWGTDWPHPNAVTPPGKEADRRHAAPVRSTTADC